ncbi:MAG: DinB family protein [Trueperaceae bacterium]
MQSDRFDLNDFDLNDAVAILERTPSSLSALLAGLPDRWLRATEGEGTWSPFEVIVHLIHVERTNWIPRARYILAGEGRPFDPFDRSAQFAESQGKSLAELLATFAELRRVNAAALVGMNLASADLSLTGQHPDFGEVRLDQLLAAWVVHDLNHVGQIVRVMARAYRGEVGPWSAYLSILRDRE